jgi:hypothetical protein
MPTVEDIKNMPTLAPDDVKRVRQISRAQWVEEASFMMLMPVGYLKDIVNKVSRGDDNIPWYRASIATMLLKTMTESDPKRYNFILDRVHGKVPIAITAHIEHPYEKILKEVSSNEINNLLERTSQEKIDSGGHEVALNHIIEAEYEVG